jgi:hypothetical protein
MPALQGQVFTLHIYPRHRLGFLVDRTGELLGNRCDFRPAPQLTLVASGAFLRIDFDNLQFVLLVKKVS